MMGIYHADCWCHRCDEEHAKTAGLPLMRTRMNLCPVCGNKRCPRSTDHRLDCTDSNAPGQPGSIYEDAAWPKN